MTAYEAIAFTFIVLVMGALMVILGMKYGQEGTKEIWKMWKQEVDRRVSAEEHASHLDRRYYEIEKLENRRHMAMIYARDYLRAHPEILGTEADGGNIEAYITRIFNGEFSEKKADISNLYLYKDW